MVRFFLKKLLPSVRVPLPARQRARDRLLWSILELNLQLQPVAGLALVKAVRVAACCVLQFWNPIAQRHRSDQTFQLLVSTPNSSPDGEDGHQVTPGVKRVFSSVRCFSAVKPSDATRRPNQAPHLAYLLHIF